MLVELEQAVGWLKENADKYIVDMAIPSYEHDFHIGGKCWEDLKAAVPEAERPKFKIRLMCPNNVEVEDAKDEKQAETFRNEVNNAVIRLEHMPTLCDVLSFNCKSGVCFLKVKGCAFVVYPLGSKEEKEGTCALAVSKIIVYKVTNKEDE